jgi:hypothetical protein
MIFDRYVIVDWSASSRPRVGKDSVWVCVLDADGRISAENPPTRRKAELIIHDALRHLVAEGQCVLVGFDFPYGYPAGLAALLGLAGPPWLAVWQYLVGRVHVHDEGAIRAGRGPEHRPVAQKITEPDAALRMARDDRDSVVGLIRELVRIPSRAGIDSYDLVLGCMSS